MRSHLVRVPDLGEGIVEAELIEWFVAVGDAVTPESVLGTLMTDKATVEVASPREGIVSSLGGKPGEVLTVGSDFVTIEYADTSDKHSDNLTPTPQFAQGEDLPEQSAPPKEQPAPLEAKSPVAESIQSDLPHESSSSSEPLAPPSLRKRARELGIDLCDVAGTGRGGRITQDDFTHFLQRRSVRKYTSPTKPDTSVPLRGLRRAVSKKMSTSWSQIPHITYIEEIDVTELESLRSHLNNRSDTDQPHLTLLPFILRALGIACLEYPHMNATFDDENETVLQSGALHVGIATQTSSGLLVPVIRHVETLNLWNLAVKISAIADAARNQSLTREELSGSTITVSSLGALGGIVTTPIINHPEVAVIGVNKKQIRPVWKDHGFVPREMMNLSSSFDHRVVDGWDAASFIHHIKSLLETPALLFVNEP